jgi:glutathione S-transferase
MEQTLSQNAWFCGEAMTAADIQMSFPVEAAAVRTNLARHFPGLQAWLERIHALPAYCAALKKGGPYELMGK